jgi:hypothetical protein
MVDAFNFLVGEISPMSSQQLPSIPVLPSSGSDPGVLAEAFRTEGPLVPARVSPLPACEPTVDNGSNISRKSAAASPASVSPGVRDATPARTSRAAWVVGAGLVLLAAAAGSVTALRGDRAEAPDAPSGDRAAPGGTASPAAWPPAGAAPRPAPADGAAGVAEAVLSAPAASAASAAPASASASAPPRRPASSRRGDQEPAWGF